MKEFLPLNLVIFRKKKTLLNKGRRYGNFFEANLLKITYRRVKGKYWP